MQTIPRLIDTFKPKNYNLSLDVSRAKERVFSGTVSITGTVMPGKHEILLHSKDLTIETVLVDGQKANFEHGEFDQLTITHDSLRVGEHVVTIGFSGKITDAMHGLYPCYFEHDGQNKELLATQFESHHAREVFPCVDEPAAKATYDVTISTAKNITVLGNMPIQVQREENEKLITIFETTPIMSSYLLAFVAGELHKKSATTKGGVEVNIWATPAHSPESLDFGLDIATRTIDFFEEYFNVKYPLAKSDNVALPDFSSGAMENWGLITYRESCLIADPKNTSESSRRSIATVITHELSHQWFGNLVTMNWWNDLWLNESFANMMEYVAVDALEPGWNIWEDWASYEVTAALRRDSMDGVQSVQTEVNHPDEISALFDGAIVYAKGGRLLYMVRKLIGEKDFRTGLTSYFNKYAYQNTVGNDLWRELENASGKPITKIMNQWISQPGLPIVEVSSDENQTKISQQRFFIGDHQKDDTLWPIPLKADSEKLPEIFSSKESVYELTDPVILNKDLSSHFVTKYDQKSKTSLLEKIKNDQVATLDKLCLLQDTSLLIRAGYENSAALLPTSLIFKNDTNEKVYQLAASLLGELRKFTESNEELSDKLKQISANFARPTFESLGWNEKKGESDSDRERRATSLSLMLYGEDESTLKEAKENLDNLGIENISPNFRSIVLSANVKHFETQRLIEQLFQTYKQTSSSDLEIDIALALTSTKSQETASKILREIEQLENIRLQDASRWFAYLIRNQKTRSTAWEWLQNSWGWVEDRFSGDKSYDEFIRYAASALSTREELGQFVEKFTPLKSEPALTRTIELGIKEISARVDLIEKDFDAVKKALEDY